MFMRLRPDLPNLRMHWARIGASVGRSVFVIILNCGCASTLCRISRWITAELLSAPSAAKVVSLALVVPGRLLAAWGDIHAAYRISGHDFSINRGWLGEKNKWAAVGQEGGNLAGEYCRPL